VACPYPPPPPRLHLRPQNRAVALAMDTASSFRQQLDAGSLAPIMALAALVQHDPSYAFLSGIFPSVVPVLASQVW
jgi:hypothetical protein